MSDLPTQTMRPDERLLELVAQYEAACTSGAAVDMEAFLCSYPHLAEAFRAHLALRNTPNITRAADTPSPEVSLKEGNIADAATLGSPLEPEDVAEAATLSPPTRYLLGSRPLGNFGDYELLAEVARGGMGVVF